MTIGWLLAPKDTQRHLKPHPNLQTSDLENGVIENCLPESFITIDMRVLKLNVDVVAPGYRADISAQSFLKKLPLLGVPGPLFDLS